MLYSALGQNPPVDNSHRTTSWQLSWWQLSWVAILLGGSGPSWQSS